MKNTLIACIVMILSGILSMFIVSFGSRYCTIYGLEIYTKTKNYCSFMERLNSIDNDCIFLYGNIDTDGNK